MRTLRIALPALMSLLFLIAGTQTIAAVVPEDRGMWTGPLLASGGPESAVTVTPRFVVRDTLYSTGGTGLRNQSEGCITLSGDGTPPPPAKLAFAYWAVITQGPYVPGLHDVLTLQKKDPERSRRVKLEGKVVGSGPDPCWPGDTITVFSAFIPFDVVNAGGGHAGVFEVLIDCAGASSCLGEDPWVAALPAPLWEGASIVALWPSPGHITSIYDVGFAGMTFIATPGATYNLVLPVPTGDSTHWDNIGADGQHGIGRTSILGGSDEVTTITGVAAVTVAGPGSSYNDSDWNGNDSNPIPSLWDTTGHDISGVGAGAAVLTVNFASASGGPDCLTPVANVVAE